MISWCSLVNNFRDENLEALPVDPPGPKPDRQYQYKLKLNFVAEAERKAGQGSVQQWCVAISFAGKNELGMVVDCGRPEM